MVDGFFGLILGHKQSTFLDVYILHGVYVHHTSIKLLNNKNLTWNCNLSVCHVVINTTKITLRWNYCTAKDMIYSFLSVFPKLYSGVMQRLQSYNFTVYLSLPLAPGKMSNIFKATVIEDSILWSPDGGSGFWTEKNPVITHWINGCRWKLYWHTVQVGPGISLWFVFLLYVLYPCPTSPKDTYYLVLWNLQKDTSDNSLHHNSQDSLHVR